MLGKDKPFPSRDKHGLLYTRFRRSFTYAPLLENFFALRMNGLAGVPVPLQLVYESHPMFLRLAITVRSQNKKMKAGK